MRSFDACLFWVIFLSLLILCHHHACITESLTLKQCDVIHLFYFHDFSSPAITRSENKNNVEFSFNILNYYFAFDDNCAHLKYTKKKRKQMFAKNTYFPQRTYRQSLACDIYILLGGIIIIIWNTYSSIKILLTN